MMRMPLLAARRVTSGTERWVSWSATAATRQVINKRSGRPGAIGGIGVQMEVDRVRRCQCQRLRRRGGCSNVLGGSAGRVCQGCPPETHGRARRIVLPGSLADVSRPESHLELVQ